MGKGKYHSNSIAESLMYWTTYLGFDVDISEFVQSEEQKRFYGRTKCYYHYATVTFKEYSYVLETAHFNLNILADDIKNHLISINHPEFSYLVKERSTMSESMFNETFLKFGSTLSLDKTFYNPAKNEYACHYTLLKFNPYHRTDLVYTHSGEYSDYIPGSFYRYIRYLAKNKQIDNENPVEISGSANIFKHNVKKILEKNGNKALEVGKLIYNINEEKYYLEFITSTNKKAFATKVFNPSIKKIKEFLHKNFPEYLI